MAWIGKLDEAGRPGVEQAVRDSQEPSKPIAKGAFRQLALIDPVQDDDTPVEPRWVEINSAAVRVENCVQFGGPWLALELVRQLRLDQFLKDMKCLPETRQTSRLSNPSWKRWSLAPARSTAIGSGQAWW